MLNVVSLMCLSLKKRIHEIVQMALTEGRLPKSAEKSGVCEILQKLKLLKNERLTNAAVILFCKTEDRQFLEAQIRLARFQGLTKDVFMDRKDLHGNIFDL